MASIIQFSNGKYAIRNWFQYLDREQNYHWCMLEYAIKYATFDTEEEALKRWEQYKNKPKFKVIRRWLW